MVIKSAEQKQFLLEAIRAVQLPGHLIDLAYEVKKEVENARIEDPSNGGVAND